MGVRRVDLTTDEVEYDSQKNEIPELPRPDHLDKDFEEPRLEEHRWITPDQAEFEEKVEAIISKMTDEDRDSLAEALRKIDKEYGQE